MKQCWSLVAKDFKDDDQSNTGIVRFSRLAMCIPRLTIFTSSLSFFMMKKKADLEILSISFAFC